MKVGDWYADITNGRVYVITFLADRYWLLNIHTGVCYGGPHKELNDDIFIGDKLHFSKVER